MIWRVAIKADGENPLAVFSQQRWRMPPYKKA
jgi:hypothetical protein